MTHLQNSYKIDAGKLMATTTLEPTVTIQEAAKNILNTIEKEREREIISRRFGLYDRRETLEQIGDLLGITRERVRQLEKSVISKLKSISHQLPHLSEIEQHFIEHLEEMGRAARIEHLTPKVSKEVDDRAHAHVHFLASLSPKLTVINENNDYHHGVAIKEHHDEKEVKNRVKELVKTIKDIGEPKTIEEIHKNTSHEHHTHTYAMATLSKKLANLKHNWGLKKWPTVNPKNIRDKIYVVLNEKGDPMHFSDIANAIQESNLRRSDVTTQAIHNELIKDARFVLIGRGIYALKEWGYSKGTVADMIVSILKKEGKPLHRDEIVKRVLKQRQVKETTILLNLQSKPQFKRVEKATYDLAEGK